MRRGADDGFERMRGQLREAAQHGDTADDFGADRIDDTAIDAMRRVERGAEDVLKCRNPGEKCARRIKQKGDDAAPAERVDTATSGEGPTASYDAPQVDQPAHPHDTASPDTVRNQIKTKETYIQHQEATPSSPQGHRPPQGSSASTTERGRKAAADRASARRESQTPAERASRNNHTDARRPNPSAHAQNVPVRSGGQTIKTAERTVDRSVKQSAKGTTKTMQKTVKTAEKTSQKAVKTAQRTAKTAQKTAEVTIKASEKAVQAARAAAKAVAASAKAAANAVATAVKAIIAAIKGLVAAIAAGGWVAVVVILVICLLALIVGSCFGIFFSGEVYDDGQSMPEVVREINAEYESELDSIKAANTYDVLEMSGSRAVWKEVLAVYAVKTTTNPDAPQDVAAMTDEKKQLLKDIFWEMNQIDSRTESSETTELVERDDGEGSIIEEEVTVTQITLYITVTHKTADEMADVYGFTDDQREQLAELLADENNELWTMVLYGISSSDEQIVAVALSQIGNVGGQPYWSWYGFGSRVEWCACFVSWCANECGYIDAGVIPKYAGCYWGAEWFKERNQWMDNSAEPSPGTIIFFDWDKNDIGQDGVPDHTGIVEKVEDGRVYTVEGNSGDSCREKSYAIGYYEIYGYGVLCP